MMRISLLLCLSFLPFWVIAQQGDFQDAPPDRGIDTTAYISDTLQQFYDFRWRKCQPQQARYFTYAFKVKNHWYCQDYNVQEKQLKMDGYFSDAALSVRDGMFTYYNTEGKVKEQGIYYMGLKYKWWLSFDDSGRNLDSTFYLNGLPAGRCVRRYATGSIQDIRLMDRKGRGAGSFTAYYETGVLMQVGNYKEGMRKDSTWIYYHKNGMPSFVQQFKADSLLSQTCYDDAGNPLKECIEERMPLFPGGKEKLLQYLGKNIRFPSGMKLNVPVAFVLAKFVINDQGVVENISILQPLHPDFDKEVIRVLKKMPLWKPGIQFNEPVRVYYTFPVSFKNE